MPARLARMSYSDRELRVAALLGDCVRTELAVINGVLDLGLDDNAIEELAAGVAAGVLYGFAVDWDPNGIGPGDIHAWEDPDGWSARCGVCLSDSPPTTSRAMAIEWVHNHQTAAH